MIGIGIGIPYNKVLSNPIVDAFKARVLADGGTFAAEGCLTQCVVALKGNSLYDKASLILTPNAYKASKMYALKPIDGSSDFVVTRASTALRRNSAGLLESVASNIPRLHYPVGGGCPSWLLEPQRTNAITQSNTFLPIPGVWYDFNGMVPVANSATDPFGANNGWLFSSESAFSRQYGLSISTAIGDVVTMSVFVKKSTATTVRLRIEQSVNASYIASATYNLDTNTVTSGTGTIENQGNGWYRISVTGTTTVINSGLRPFLDSVNGNLFVFGFQAEIGAYATSYIPTTTSSVTRLQDQYIKTGISSLIGQTEGTLFADINVNAWDSSSFYFGVYGGGNEIYFRCAASGRIDFVHYFGSTQCLISATGLSLGRHKIAARYKNNDWALYIDGVQIGVDTSGSFSGAIGTVSLGYVSPSVYPPFAQYNPCLVFNTALTNAELAALSTL